MTTLSFFPQEALAKNEDAGQKCERAHQRLALTQRLAESKKTIATVASDADAILTKYIKSSEKAHYDTESLKSVQKKLASNLEEFKSNVDTYGTRTSALESFDCTKNADSFQTRLSEARMTRATTQKSLQNLQNVLSQDIPQALQDYAAWISSIKGDPQ